jgi:hypothetical protein
MRSGTRPPARRSPRVHRASIAGFSATDVGSDRVIAVLIYGQPIFLLAFTGGKAGRRLALPAIGAGRRVHARATDARSAQGQLARPRRSRRSRRMRMVRHELQRPRDEAVSRQPRWSL